MLIDYITSDDEFKQLALEWNQLLRASGANSIFLTWEWLYCWWNIFKNDSTKLLIVLVRDTDGVILCLAPLMIEKTNLFKVIPVTTIRFLGTGEREQDEISTEYLDFIITEKANSKVIINNILNDLIEKNRDVDYLMFENISDTSLLLENIKKTQIAGVTKHVQMSGESHYIELEKDWDAFLSKLSTSQRYRVRRTLKEFKKQEDFLFEIASNKDQLKEAFSQLTKLHQKRWNSKGYDGVFSSNYFCQFHTDLMEMLVDKGNLMLAKLIINDEACAVIYNFNYDGVISFYQSGIDTNLENNRLRPGLAIHALAIEFAIKTGASRYDFLMGGSNYKGQWTKAVKTIYRIQLDRKKIKVTAIRVMLAIKKVASKLLKKHRVFIENYRYQHNR